MKSELLCKTFGMLLLAWSISILAGCAVPSAVATPSATITAVAECQPSPFELSQVGFSEIQGTMHSDGEVWALLFFDRARVNQELKIVWRVTGTGEELTVQARHPDGTEISPVWGPEMHGESNWERPGFEWGTGFDFPEPGCWTLTSTSGTTVGEIRLNVAAQ